MKDANKGIEIMSNDILRVSKVKFPLRVLLILVSLIFASYAIFSVSSFYNDGELINIFIISFPVLFFAIYAILWAVKKVVVVGSEFIETTVFKTKRIYFVEIKQVGIYKNHIEIKAGTIKIGINSEIEDQQSIIDQLLSSIDFKNDKLVFEGNRDEIDKYI